MATKSEVRRWIKQGWISVNAEPVTLDDELIAIHSCVLHGKSDVKRVTLL